MQYNVPRVYRWGPADLTKPTQTFILFIPSAVDFRLERKSWKLTASTPSCWTSRPQRHVWRRNKRRRVDRLELRWGTAQLQKTQASIPPIALLPILYHGSDQIRLLWVSPNRIRIWQNVQNSNDYEPKTKLMDRLTLLRRSGGIPVWLQVFSKEKIAIYSHMVTTIEAEREQSCMDAMVECAIATYWMFVRMDMVNPLLFINVALKARMLVKST